MNIHIGCEHKIGKSWMNYDITYVAIFEKIPLIGKLIKINNNRYPKEVRFGDISKSLLCEENTADNIYCSHTLEHMTLDDMQNSLLNIYKMLKPNGCFRLIVPDLRTRAENYIKNKDANQFLNSIGMGRKKSNKKFIDKLRNVFGNSIHQWMYDADSMEKYLSDVGFKSIKPCKFGDSGINVFSEVEDGHRFIDNDFNFVEVAFQCTK
jgi:predicted SAM-dependent methyltransferase